MGLHVLVLPWRWEKFHSWRESLASGGDVTIQAFGCERKTMRTIVVTLALVVAASELPLTAQTTSTTAPQQVHANLNQLMRGVLYPAANVVFFPQFENPAAVKQAPDPGMATDPLTSTFGGWQAVENAALALAESANLLMVPGRVCSNGAPVPLTDPAWTTFAQEVRDAGMKAYALAQAKDQDKLSDLSETVSAACSHCHRKWRDRKTAANRCK
jgi:hypothetical protein